ncbi:hypothetical protein FMN50_22515 [Rhodobacterales bacterium]|nr:hypothetical protein FMN50_22515 [Rhodobacterales bacterium]
MLPDKFRVAMFNRLGLGPYFQPARIETDLEEWLIVERFGRNGEYLVVSTAGTEQDPASFQAPPDLVEHKSMLGILIDIALDGEGATFLFTRNLVGNQVVKGSFFPADGYVTLERHQSGIRLTAAGRHAHDISSGPRGPVFKHIPEPTPAAEGEARNWHFDAVMRPWVMQSLEEPAHLELI